MLRESRGGILKSVTNTLKFLTLTMLVMEATLVALAFGLKEYRGLLIGSIIGFLILFVASAIFLEIRNQQAGTWLPPYAALFAQDLHDVLDGYLADLHRTIQNEAWASLADVLEEFDDASAPAAYREFRTRVATSLKKKAALKKAVVRTQGPILSTEEIGLPKNF